MATVGFGLFRLPPEIRVEIYKLALAVPQTLLLFQSKGSRVEAFAPGQLRCLELLYVSRRMHHEVRAVLYGSCRFNLVNTTRHQSNILGSFLGSIGPANASALSSLCISFPCIQFVEGGPGILVKTDDAHCIRILRAQCTNLTRLEAFVYHHNSTFLATCGAERARRALQKVQAHMRSIPSLHSIIVRNFTGNLSPEAIEVMHELGWVVLQGNREQ